MLSWIGARLSKSDSKLLSGLDVCGLLFGPEVDVEILRAGFDPKRPFGKRPFGDCSSTNRVAGSAIGEKDESCLQGSGRLSRLEFER